MSQGRIQEFLQITLKQAWALDDNVVIKPLQASKHELAKLQCLMPLKGGHNAGLWPILSWGLGCQQRVGLGSSIALP